MMVRGASPPLFDASSIPGGRYTFYAGFAAFFLAVGYVIVTQGGRIQSRTKVGTSGPGWRSSAVLSERDTYLFNPMRMSVSFGIPELNYPAPIRKKIARYQELERRIERMYLAGKSPDRLEEQAAELLDEIEGAVAALAEEGEGFQPSRDLDDPIEVRFAHEYAEAMGEPTSEYMISRLRSIEGMGDPTDEEIEQAAAEAYYDRQALIRRMVAHRGRRPALEASRWLRKRRKTAPVFRGKLPELA